MATDQRTTADLIQELDDEAKKFTYASLVVGFEKTTAFVNSADPERHNKLDAAMKSGGDPIGIIAITPTATGGTLYCRALAEHAGETAVTDFLHWMMDHVAQFIGGQNFERLNGWTN